jgi:hypothetical protein
MNARSQQVLLYLFLAVYILPLGALCSSLWLHLTALQSARDLAEAYSGGMQFSVNGLMILFLTLSSSRRATADEPVWSGQTLTICIVLTAIATISLILAATIKTNLGPVTAELGPIGMDHLYTTAMRYSTEATSYAALVLGIRYKLDAPAGQP